MDRQPAAQVWQGEGALAIATVRGADQLEEGFVFGDRKNAAVAERPADRGEVASEHADFTNVRLCHGSRKWGGSN